MKINNIRINGFGNLKNKNIDLKDKINIIYGKNESGKSTLLKFILNVLYGTSKNKKGKDISDFDKFKPWKSEEFSGKISYELNNNKIYEVYREFNKRSPKIYNELGEEISNNFNIDKNKGNEFFYEQTQIDEDLFLSSNIVMQKESKLDKNSQNNIIQKITNLASTGYDNISFKKIIEKLNKRQLTEIGTERTQDRPINKLEQKIKYLQNEKNNLFEYKNKSIQIEELIESKKQIILEKENEKELIKQIKYLKEMEKLESEKLNINNTIKIKYIEQLKDLNIQNNNLDNYVKENNKNINLIKFDTKKYIIIFIILILINFLSLIFIKNNIINIILASTVIILFMVCILKNNIINNSNRLKIKENENKTNEVKIQKDKIETQIEVIEKNIYEKEKEIIQIKEKLNKKLDFEKKLILKKYINNINIEKINYLFNLKEVNNNLNSIEDEINKERLELNGLEIEEKNIIMKLDNLANIEEILEESQDEYNSLKSNNLSINLAKQVIENSYKKMKENITPKFTKNLSKTIEKISNGKYKKIKLNTEDGLIVELDNGEYIPVELLSVGTIDQLYLALRLSIIKEISEENIPIILDEAFAYYDEERLEQILKYIAQEIRNQVIILTCTYREKNILDKLNIKNNFINI